VHLNANVDQKALVGVIGKKVSKKVGSEKKNAYLY
jgi:hypothetical protein